MVIDQLAAAIYRASPGTAPGLVLKRLGIATSRRREEFYTLERLTRELRAPRGAVLECGVYRGATLLGMTHILNCRGIKPRVFGLDSFEGFPEPTPQDAQESGAMHPDVHAGALADTSYQALLDRIRLLHWQDRITVIKGFFERTLPALDQQRFDLVHLDCDLYSSYRTCLEFVYPRMLPNSVIVLDDYKLPANVYPGADRAVDEFFADKPEKPQRFDHPKGLRSFVRIAGN
ncbi:MAG TPA: TylF/MycF/NovP-related O-methyltransferase [Candidatus Sulfotelmatobacter sp.]|nr:TylF/MycF/NovP-related O-methyltransferase [Candidatus Sulfotelmatobacter sp.]